MVNKIKVMVINSPLFREKNPLYDEDSLPPLGLGIISTVIKEDGHHVELVDAVAENIPLHQLIEKIELKKPDYICANIFTTNYNIVKELIESLRVNTHIILGGLSTKDLHTQIFSWKSENHIDVVHGDGDRIIAAIINRKIDEAAIFAQHNRNYYSVNTHSKYYVHDLSGEKIDRSFFKNEPVKHPLGFLEANIVTSRGCVYNCAFCAAARSINASMSVREKGEISIITEIQQLINIYPGLESVRILDDLFLKSAKTIDKAIAIFKNFNLKWRAMAHVETFRNVNEETILKLKESGCSELFIGIESGSPRILKKIHKVYDINKIKANIGLLLKNGVNVKGYFIYGFPEENEEDFKLTLELAEHLKAVSLEFGTVFRTSVFQYRPYHGTELYHQIIENEKADVNKILPVQPNAELSHLVGRLQFNLHSGNLSAASIEVVQDYIYKTLNLNSLCIFGLNGSSKQSFNTN
jgi:anaerobic magnesium-protoporphyrin IX monomethyl ester cyclase